MKPWSHRHVFVSVTYMPRLEQSDGPGAGVEWGAVGEGGGGGVGSGATSVGACAH